MSVDLAKLRKKAEAEIKHHAKGDGCRCGTRHLDVNVEAGDLLDLVGELERLRQVEERLKWLATKPDRTKEVGRWWGNEIDAALAAGVKA